MKTFADRYNINSRFNDWKKMVSDPEIDAIYIGVPTGAKEDIALEAANAGKHLMVEKPFEDVKSVQRIIEAARKK